MRRFALTAWRVRGTALRPAAMRMPSPRFIAVSAALAVLVTASGCARNKTTKGDTPYIARDVNTLYSAAKTRLDRNDFQTAAALFDEVERQHPYSPAIKTRLMPII
jgi:outer membrane protein assembly factor BamD